jgi:ABC-type transporter Mla maintaining outer membrane lipid asymmetry permease subunit MlaE
MGIALAVIRCYWSLLWFVSFESRLLYRFGAVSWMPSMVKYFNNSRGPIITALICAGRIGSGIGAWVHALPEN